MSRGGSGWLQSVDAWLFGGVDPVRLDTFRRCLALTFLLYVGFWFLNAGEWLTDAGFHFTAETERREHPDPWPTLPAWAVPLFGAVLFGSALGVTCGWSWRLLDWVLLGCAIYLQRVDPISASTPNKLYIASFAVLSCAPRPFTTRGPEGEVRALQSAWPIRVLQATLIIQYSTAGLCKVIHGDWLQNRLVIWTHVQGLYRTSAGAILLDHMPLGAWSAARLGSLSFELASPVLFTVRRLVPIGIAWGILFHLGIALTMEKLIFFSLQMMGFYVLFIDARTLRRLRGLGSHDAIGSTPGRRRSAARQIHAAR